MQDENAQVAQEGINAGKKLLQGLEKNKKELENTAKNVTRPVANKAKNKAVNCFFIIRTILIILYSCHHSSACPSFFQAQLPTA